MSHLWPCSGMRYFEQMEKYGSFFPKKPAVSLSPSFHLLASGTNLQVLREAVRMFQSQPSGFFSVRNHIQFIVYLQEQSCTPS